MRLVVLASSTSSHRPSNFMSNAIRIMQRLAPSFLGNWPVSILATPWIWRRVSSQLLATAFIISISRDMEGHQFFSFPSDWTATEWESPMLTTSPTSLPSTRRCNWRAATESICGSPVGHSMTMAATIPISRDGSTKKTSNCERFIGTFDSCIKTSCLQNWIWKDNWKGIKKNDKKFVRLYAQPTNLFPTISPSPFKFSFFLLPTGVSLMVWSGVVFYLQLCCWLSRTAYTWAFDLLLSRKSAK